MAWTKEQKRIFSIWAGKVPVCVLADFVNKSEAALAKYASRQKVSVSFLGRGCQRNAKKRKPREFYQHKNHESDPSSHAEQKQLSTHWLINAVFS